MMKTTLTQSLTAQKLEEIPIRDERPSAFELLPPELKIRVLGFSEPKAVRNIALVGPLLYRFVRINETEIAQHTVLSHIPRGLRSLAASRYYAEHLGYPLAREESNKIRSRAMVDNIKVFCRGLSDDNTFDPRYRDVSYFGNLHISLNVADKIVSFHKTAKKFASTLATIALKKAPLSIYQLIDVGQYPLANITNVSPREHERFVKSLYLFDIASIVLPPVESFGQSHFGIILYHIFWNNFVPWEQDQVRCIQVMIQGWLRDLITAQGGYKTIQYSQENLGQFAISKGVAGLKRDEFWVSYDVRADRVRLEPSYMLDKWYQDVEDTGPQDSWLHTLLENRVYDESFKSGFEIQFSCESCMTQWGYVFWDREKMDYHSKYSMPTSKEMLKIAKQAPSLPHDTFHALAWGRQSGICHGCPWSAQINEQLGSAHHRFESWRKITGSLV
ncbi:hypothetical protein F5Y02DRAFT_428490 [Annulohypoxylon stygium]|nr:hypothetical protein F5Y02DRAFT_428490 [Annulohypoxylon stygium]